MFGSLIQVSRPNTTRHEQARLLQPELPRAILCYSPLTHQSSPLVSCVDVCSWFSLLVVEPIGLRFIARPTGCAIFIRYRLYGFAVRIQVAQLKRLSSEGRFFLFLAGQCWGCFPCPRSCRGVVVPPPDIAVGSLLFPVVERVVVCRYSRVVPLHLSCCVWVADTSIAPKLTPPQASSPPATRVPHPVTSHLTSPQATSPRHEQTHPVTSKLASCNNASPLSYLTPFPYTWYRKKRSCPIGQPLIVLPRSGA